MPLRAQHEKTTPLVEGALLTQQLDSQFSPIEVPSPTVGQVLFGFELIEVLGSGGFAQVFLARQKELADRPVALKVTFGPDAESQNLARLQHTNIVPIYSVHKADGMVAVCMPFLGRSTLSGLCDSLLPMGKVPETGRQLVAAITARKITTRPNCNASSEIVSAESNALSSGTIEQVAGSPREPIIDSLRSMNYVDAVLWVCGRIAEGLAHAHERGILHRDLKPANILLTDDGQPMILDFNLSASMNDAHLARGGTLPYMSPEQVRASLGQEVTVDARSDIYSLGLIAAQLLMGRYPFPHLPRASLARAMAMGRGLPAIRRVSPRVSPTVEAIVHKCLAVDPAHRYQSANELIEDLNRHRAHLPTIHAPNPSLRERAHKWAIRNPRFVSPPSIAAAVTAVLLLVVSAVTLSSIRAERRLIARNAERGREMVGQFESMRGNAEQYLTAHNDQPELLEIGRAMGNDALHLLTDGHGSHWVDRPEFRHLPPDDRKRLQLKAGELVALLGRSSPSFTELAPLAASVERSAILQASEMQANGKFRESIPGLTAHLRTAPDDAGGWFLLGRAQAECGELNEAFQAYSTGIALRPQYAPGYHFRADVADRLRMRDSASNKPLALLDADRAIALAPNLLEARLRRAQVLIQGRQFAEARDELDHVLAQPSAPNRAWLMRAQVMEFLGEKSKSVADRTAGIDRPAITSADWIARGRARRSTDPVGAIADFEKAAELAPFDTLPLENQAYVEAEMMHRPDLAARTLARLLEKSSSSPLIYISRAVYLARSGDLKEAISQAEKARELNSTPGVLYRIGCVYSLAAKKDPAFAAPALRHIAEAIQAGFGHEYLIDDNDLDPLRGDSRFGKLLELTRHLRELSRLK